MRNSPGPLSLLGGKERKPVRDSRTRNRIREGTETRNWKAEPRRAESDRKVIKTWETKDEAVNFGSILRIGIPDFGTGLEDLTKSVAEWNESYPKVKK